MWMDPALDYSWMEPCKYNLSLNSILLEKLWTPNSCFINSKTADIHKVLAWMDELGSHNRPLEPIPEHLPADLQQRKW